MVGGSAESREGEQHPQSRTHVMAQSRCELAGVSAIGTSQPSQSCTENLVFVHAQATYSVLFALHRLGYFVVMRQGVWT